ncbi:ATP-grasp domain-containing protein [Lachnospiraceae bacterium KH1T2]|nr:ATP-grasp domain-containing protein [Lachnospiraceae bacterium KH1T2]
MPRKNILVFPCGSEIALEIYKAAGYSTYFHLIGASSIHDHGEFVYEDYIGNLPFANDSRLLRELKEIVNKRQIDAIYPSMDKVITLLKENEEYLGCKIIGSPVETTRICLSKRKTYDTLRKTINVPMEYERDSILRYPVFAKPDIGYGSKGTAIINSEEELCIYLEKYPNSIITEYLPGDEYTIDCFTNKEGELLYAAARKRNRIKCGISVNTTFVGEQAPFIEIANKINEKIKFRGAWFAQVKYGEDGELYLLETAARLGGSSALSRAKGINSALLTLFDAFDFDVKIEKNDYDVEIDRSMDCKYHLEIDYDVVYVDYDDCLILDSKKINTELVRFLYQCINNQKSIILLSKHIGDLENELLNYRLLSLFDEIIRIDRNQCKADYIKENTKFIFIDDSFAERQRIKDKFLMPVFSPEMVECLIN